MSTSQSELETRRALNPLFNGNKLKLGLFGVNVSNGCAITTVEGRHEVSWPTSLAIARTADRHGYEAMVPVARWRGFGGESNFNGTNFETYTWAAGLGQATENICVLTTSHVPTIHPIVAAKQATTVDHITNGRFALNVVCGWFTPELEMFGVPQMEHDTRYDYGTNFETYTWAAGLGQATENICVLTTSHVPTIHPIVAAKQATTVDHITNGRFALNVVCGWFTPELEMFGVPQMEHDTRYDYAA